MLSGNLPRFRRMYFNLIMNAVDAMSQQKVGVLRTTACVEGDRVVLQVSDDGSGMTPEKRQHLLTDKESLDGELHSLGFVFVRQTVEEFQGELSIDSELGKGTTITIRLPYLPGKTVTRGSPSSHEEYGLRPHVEQPRESRRDPRHRARFLGAASTGEAESAPGSDKRVSYGKLVLEDYQASRAQFPGASSPSRSPKTTRSTASRTSPTSATGTSRTKTCRPCSSNRRCAAAWRRTNRRIRC